MAHSESGGSGLSSTAGPSRNKGGAPANPLWKHFERDPPLGAGGTNPKAFCLACKQANTGHWFLAKQKHNLISHLLDCKHMPGLVQGAEEKQLDLDDYLAEKGVVLDY